MKSPSEFNDRKGQPVSRLAIFIAILLFTGCAYRTDDMWVSDIEKEHFSFLKINSTTKEDVLDRYAPPASAFEDDNILAYQIVLFKKPIFVWTGVSTSEVKAYPDFRVIRAGTEIPFPWYYEVLLAFDDRSVLVERRIRAIFAEALHALRNHKVE